MSTERRKKRRKKRKERIRKITTTYMRWLRLRHILKHKESYYLFMEYLLHEFSHENLLALTEMVQFQSHALELGPMPSNMEAQDELVMTLAHDIPQSAIVNDANMTLKEKARALIGKYLLNSSEFSLNVPHSVRAHYARLFHSDSNQSEAIEARMFELAWTHTARLMKDSFSRFVFTEDCRQMVHNNPLLFYNS